MTTPPPTSYAVSQLWIPPKPPDLTFMNLDETPTQPSFKQKLITPFSCTVGSRNADTVFCTKELQMEKDSGDELNDDNTIPLSLEDKNRLYLPWKFSVIIKLFGKRMSHQYLKSKLKDLWKVSEELLLIDSRFDYFIVKFLKEESMQKALHNGPWFINGFFLSIKKWHPNFVASEAEVTSLTIWVRLPELPTEFYDTIILSKIGSKLGRLLKIDTCTSATLRGRYARICVEVPIGIPVKTHITIGRHKHNLFYEGADILCKTCGRLGHIHLNCAYKTTTSPTEIE